MEEILDDIGHGRLTQALIRLWLRAEKSEAGAQVLSRWLVGFSVERHRAEVKRLAPRIEDREPLDPSSPPHPLALIVVLDRLLSDEDWTVPMVPAVDGHPIAPDLELAGIGYWLVRRDRPLKPSLPIDRQSPNLEQWFLHFRVIPSHIPLRNSFIEVSLRISGDLPLLPHGGKLPYRVHVTHFRDEAALVVEEDPDGNSFRVTGLTHETQRSESLWREFEFVSGFGADLWVVPELTVPPSMRGQLVARMASLPGDTPRPLLTVPGSFHEVVAGDPVNHAVLLDGIGRTVARHNKLTRFSYPGPDGVPLSEAIIAARRIELVVTAIGLVAIPICKDFCDGSSELVRTAWSQLAPDWLLVPSMGDEKQTLKAHLERAEEHWKLRGMRTLVANQEPSIAGKTMPDPVPGFAGRGVGFAGAPGRNRPRLKVVR